MEKRQQYQMVRKTKHLRQKQPLKLSNHPLLKWNMFLPQKRNMSAKYLSLAQINGHRSASQQLAQGMHESRGQRSGLIESHPSQVPTGIGEQKATAMQDSAHHAHRSVVLQQWAGQPALRPDDDVVGQRTEQHDHLLSRKAFFVAFAQTQALLVALERGFNAATALIVEAHVGQQYGSCILKQVERLASQRENLLSRQSGNQDARGKISISLATPYRTALDRMDRHIGRFAHPAELPLSLMGIDVPLGDAFGQTFGLLPRGIFAMNQIATHEQPIDIMQRASTSINADNGATALLHIQLHRPCCRQHKRLQGASQVRLAIKETINHDFPRATGQDATQWATTTVPLLGNVAF